MNSRNNFKNWHIRESDFLEEFFTLKRRTKEIERFKHIMNFRRLIRKMYEKGISDDYLSYYTDRVKSELSSFLLKRIKICQSNIKRRRKFMDSHGKRFNCLLNYRYPRISGIIKWRKEVLKRDNYKCQECGNVNNLQAHHIIRYVDDESKRLDIDNGITLCKRCHKNKHKKHEKGGMD